MFAILNNHLLPKVFVRNNSKPTQKSLMQNPQVVSGELLSLIVEYADISKDIGGGMVSLSVSKSALKDSHIRNVFCNHIDRVCNIVVIWSDITASVISVIQPQNRNISNLN